MRIHFFLAIKLKMIWRKIWLRLRFLTTNPKYFPYLGPFLYSNVPCCCCWMVWRRSNSISKRGSTTHQERLQRKKESSRLVMNKNIPRLVYPKTYLFCAELTHNEFLTKTFYLICRKSLWKNIFTHFKISESYLNENFLNRKYLPERKKME